MSENKKVYKKVKLQSPVITVLKLYIIGITAFIAILSVFSFIVMKIHTSQAIMQFYVIADAAVVAFSISMICCIQLQHKKLIYGMILSVFTGISEFLLIVCFNNAAIATETYFLIPAVIIFSFAGCISGSNIKHKNKKRRLIK